MTKVCSIEGCGSGAIKRGWCSKHYQRWRTGRNLERSILDPNEVIIEDSVAYLVLRGGNQLNHREVGRVKIDVGDLPLVQGYKWHLDTGYASAAFTNRRKIYMHRLLLDTPNEVDHRDRNRLNNCRSNLRPATHAQNMANASKRSNTSGHKNVMFDRRPGRGWYVQISYQGVKKFFGYFSAIEKAVKIRDKVLRYEHGEFARNQR